MKNDIARILIKFRDGELFLNETCDKILSLMGENEIGVSDAPERKHGVLHDVRESHASDLSDAIIEHTNGAALEKITEAKEDFYCHDYLVHEWGSKCTYQCGNCRFHYAKKSG